MEVLEDMLVFCTTNKQDDDKNSKKDHDVQINIKRQTHHLIMQSPVCGPCSSRRHRRPLSRYPRRGLLLPPLSVAVFPQRSFAPSARFDVRYLDLALLSAGDCSRNFCDFRPTTREKTRQFSVQRPGAPIQASLSPYPSRPH